MLECALRLVFDYCTRGNFLPAQVDSRSTFLNLGLFEGETFPEKLKTPLIHRWLLNLFLIILYTYHLFLVCGIGMACII